MEKAIAVLDMAAKACEANEPVNRASGCIEQADLEKETARQCRAAITLLQLPAASS